MLAGPEGSANIPSTVADLINPEDLAGLSEQEMILLRQCIEELGDTGRSPTASALVAEDYKWEPVSMATFLADPYYFGAPELAGKMYPQLKQLAIDVMDARPRPIEVVMGGAIGWGKTMGMALLQTYLAYRLTCLRNPHNYYGLLKGSTIVLGLYSVSLDQAMDTSYGKIMNWVDDIPYFQEKCPRIKRLTTRIKFAESPIEIIAGSREIHTIGKDLFSVGIDEANFMTAKTGEVDEGIAYAIYNGVRNRLKSRFITSAGEPAGMAIIASSKRTKVSFVEEHVKASAAEIAAGRIRVYSYNQWEVRPKAFYSKPKFRVEIGDRIFPSRILKDGEDPRAGADCIEVPGEYRSEFDSDVDKSLRELAGIATESLLPLLHDKQAVSRCAIAEHAHPFSRETFTISTGDDIGIESYFLPDAMFRVVRSNYVMRMNPQFARFVHVDIGLTGDCMGICMLHISGFKTVRRARNDGTWFEDKAPVVTVDFMVQIKPPMGNEIDLSKMRAFLISLRDYGVPIWRVSFDGYQCFTSDTRVRLLNGTSPTMKELADTYGRDQEFWVYSFDEEAHQFVPGRARNARKTGTKQVMEVEVDGQPVRCTEDHPWMLRDGTWRLARDLQVGDSLMACQTKISIKSEDGLDGYEMIRQPKGRGIRGNWQYTHRMVANEFPDGPRTQTVHHVNFDRRDNTPANLQWMPYTDHLRLHQQFCQRTYALPGWWTPERRAQQSLTIKLLHLNPAYHANAAKNCRPLLPGAMSPSHRQSIIEYQRQKWASGGWRGVNHPHRVRRVTADKVLRMARLHPHLSQRELGELLEVSQDVVALRLDEAGVGRSRGWRSRLATNHSVTAIRFTGAVEDVYDIEVDVWHNFVLAAGVVVHNSRDSQQILKKLGFDSVVYSVDRTDEAYLSLRGAIMENRIIYYDYSVFEREVIELERDIDNCKVDHPAKSPTTGSPGSKDVSDAVAGALFNALAEKRLVPGMGIPSMHSRDNVQSQVEVPGGALLWSDLDREVRK